MAIPLFGTDYLASPTAGGAISGKAAQIFAEEGARLTKRIEEQAVIAEARAKAPVLATAYADGLTKIAQGDMSGFESIARTEAEAVGNPFLMQMTRSASSEASRMASNIFQSRQQEAMLSRQMENNRALLDRQREDDWRAGEIKAQQTYEKEVADWQQSEAGRKRQAEIEGVPYTPTQPPPKPQPQPRPSATSRAYGGGTVSTGIEPELPTGGATKDIQPMPGTPAAKADAIQTNALMAGDEIVNEAVTKQAPPEQLESQPLVNEKSQAAPQEGIELGVQRKPEVRGDTMVVPFGRMNWHINSPSSKKMKVSETVQTGTGSKTYTMQSGDDADKPTELAGLISEIDSKDQEFSQWASNMIMQGKRVSVEPNPNDPKLPWIAKTSDGEVMVVKNPEASKMTEEEAKKKGIKNTMPRPISPEVGTAWSKARAALTEVGQAARKEFPPTKQNVEEMAQEQIKRINEGKATLDEVNKIRKEEGFAPLTQKQLDEGRPTVVSDSVRKQLEEQGIKDPNKQEEKKEEKPKQAREKIKDLEKEIRQLKKQLTTNPEVYGRIAQIQEQINKLDKQLGLGESVDSPFRRR